ncbi:MAG: efflux RND transporter periplasmic adaptor subunit [Planctomycetota bacterium]
MFRWIFGILFGLVLLVVGGSVVVMGSPLGDRLRQGMEPQDNSTEVTFAIAERGNLSRTVAAPGAIEPLRVVEVSAEVSARVVELPFREGDEVGAGEVIVRLDSRDLEANLTSARAGLISEEARLDGAKADFLRTRADFGRVTELYDTRDVSKSDLDLSEAEFLGAQSRLKQAEQSIEIAKANIARAETDLDNAIITTPMAGTVTKLNAEVGETVVVGTLNNAGSIIMEIADLSTMLCTAQVDQTNIAMVEPGQRAIIYVNAYEDREFEGVVERVALKMDRASDGVGFFQTEIVVELSEGDLLYTGLSATADILVETFEDMIVVPSQAVLDRRVEDLPKDVRESSEHVDAEKTFARVVYLEKDGKAIATPVRVGASDLTRTVIEAGLEEGDRVVAGPYRVLVDIKHDRSIREEGTEPESPATDEDAEVDGAEDEDPTGDSDDDSGAAASDAD